MKIKTKEMDAGPELLLTAAMVQNTKVLSTIAHLYKPGYIESPHLRALCSWCVEYFNQYAKAPGPHIKHLVAASVKDGTTDGDQESLIQMALDNGLAKSSSKINADFVVDEAMKMFTGAALSEVCSEVSALIARGALVEAKERMASYDIPELEKAGTVDPFTDTEAIFNAFDDEDADEKLFKLNGALGDMFNEHLVREGFLGMLAPEKRGKTWMCLMLAIAARKAKRNVVFFGAGDMTQRQYIRRLHIALAQKSDKAKYTGDQIIPTYDCMKNQNGSCKHKHRACKVMLGLDLKSPELEKANSKELFAQTPKGYLPCDWCRRRKPELWFPTHWYTLRHIDKPLQWREAVRNSKRFTKLFNGREFKLECYPNDTLTVPMIKARLRTWYRREGWVPDVVIIDYADILLPDDKRIEFRHQENQKWKGMRAMSQLYKCLVIVPTQANTKSYDAHTLDLKHFSEDKRKFAHVTGMFGLNQTPTEKKQGVMRLNWLLLREDEFETAMTVKVLQSIKTGQPALGSYVDKKG